MENLMMAISLATQVLLAAFIPLTFLSLLVAGIVLIVKENNDTRRGQRRRQKVDAPTGEQCTDNFLPR